MSATTNFSFDTKKNGLNEILKKNVCECEGISGIQIENKIEMSDFNGNTFEKNIYKSSFFITRITKNMIN